jgi:hypothetical protein
MAHDALKQSGKGSEAERGSWTDRAAGCITRSHAAPFPRVRAFSAPGISVSGGGLPAGSTGGSHGGHGADNVETPAAHSGTAAQACEKPWADDGNDRDGRIAGVPGCKEEAWLSRAPEAARSKSTLTMSLIACSSRSSPRPTIFWFPLGSAPCGA